MSAPVERDAFKRRVHQWAAKIGVEPREIVVMEMKRKWASCSNRGRICFASDVLRLPTSLQDYIAAHELMHLRHRNHSRLFRATLSAVLPKWRDAHVRLAGFSTPDRQLTGR